MGKQWKGLLVALLVLAAGVLPAFAQPVQPFCDFLIDAAGADVLQQTISIQRYEASGTGRYQAAERVEVDCALNRITQDATFYIQPKADGVSVTADYLTDLDGDGIYEQLAGREVSLWDDLTFYAAADPGQQSQTLAAGQTYLLSAQALVEGNQQEARARADLLDLTTLDQGNSHPLCLISLRYAPTGGQEQVLSYYLRLYGPVIMPDDVSPDASYYDAVEYVLARGYFAGIDANTFQPDGPFTRAQLAQILWRLGDRCPPAAALSLTWHLEIGITTRYPGATKTGL